MAAYALDCCRNPKVVQPLLDATRDDIEPVRGQAAVSLGRIAAPAAYDRLVEMLKDPDPKVREDVVNGLRWFGDRKAIPEIEKLRKGDPDESVRKMADRTVMELSRK